MNLKYQKPGCRRSKTQSSGEPCGNGLQLNLIRKCTSHSRGIRSNHSWALLIAYRWRVFSEPHRLKKDSQHAGETSRSTSWDERLYSFENKNFLAECFVWSAVSAFSVTKIQPVLSPSLKAKIFGKFDFLDKSNRTRSYRQEWEKNFEKLSTSNFYWFKQMYGDLRASLPKPADLNLCGYPQLDLCVHSTH